MNNCNNLKKSKITIKLKRDNLLYDISQQGFLSSESIALKFNDNQHVKHRLKDVVEDGNIDIILRELDNAYTHSLMCLSQFIADCCCNSSEEITMTDDYDDYRDSYDYTLYITHARALALARRLTSLLHDYLVSSAICRYISIIEEVSQSAEIYKQREEEALQDIIALLSMNSCERPIIATL